MPHKRHFFQLLVFLALQNGFISGFTISAFLKDLRDFPRKLPIPIPGLFPKPDKTSTTHNCSDCSTPNDTTTEPDPYSTDTSLKSQSTSEVSSTKTTTKIDPMKPVDSNNPNIPWLPVPPDNARTTRSAKAPVAAPAPENHPEPHPLDHSTRKTTDSPGQRTTSPENDPKKSDKIDQPKMGRENVTTTPRTRPEGHPKRGDSARMHTTVLLKDKEPEGKPQSTKGPITEATEPTSFKRPQIRGDRLSTDHTTKATEAPDDPQKSSRPAKPENDDSSPRKRPNKTEKHPDDTDKRPDDSVEPKNGNSLTKRSTAIPIKNPDGPKKPRKGDDPTTKSTDASRHTGPSNGTHHPPASRTTTRRHVDPEGPKKEPAKHTTERPRHTEDPGEPEKIHHSTTVENPFVNPHAVPSVDPEKEYHTTPKERATERTSHTGGHKGPEDVRHSTESHSTVHGPTNEGPGAKDHVSTKYPTQATRSSVDPEEPEGVHHSTRRNTSVYRSTSDSEKPRGEDHVTKKGSTQPARPASGPHGSKGGHHSTENHSTVHGPTKERPGDKDHVPTEYSTQATGPVRGSDGPEGGHHPTRKNTSVYKSTSGSKKPSNEDHSTAKGSRQPARLTSGPGPHGGHHSTKKNTSVYKGTSSPEKPSNEDHSTTKGSTQPAKPASGLEKPGNAHLPTENHGTVHGPTKEGPGDEEHVPTKYSTQATRPSGGPEGPEGSHYSTEKNTGVYRSTNGSEKPSDEDHSTTKGSTQPARPTSGPESPDNAHHSTKKGTTITGRTGNPDGPTKEDQTTVRIPTERTRHTYVSKEPESGHHSTGKHPNTEDEPSDGSESPEKHTTEPVKPADGSGEPNDHTFITTEKSKHPGGSEEPTGSDLPASKDTTDGSKPTDASNEPSVSGRSTASRPGKGSEPSGNPDEPRVSEPSGSGWSTASSPGEGSEPSGNPDEPRVSEPSVSGRSSASSPGQGTELTGNPDEPRVSEPSTTKDTATDTTATKPTNGSRRPGKGDESSTWKSTDSSGPTENPSVSTTGGPLTGGNTTVWETTGEHITRERHNVTGSPRNPSNDGPSQTSISKSPGGTTERSGEPVYKKHSGATTMKSKHPDFSTEPTDDTYSTPKGTPSSIAEPTDGSKGPNKDENSSTNSTEAPDREPTGGSPELTSDGPLANKGTTEEQITGQSSTREHYTVTGGTGKPKNDGDTSKTEHPDVSQAPTGDGRFPSKDPGNETEPTAGSEGPGKSPSMESPEGTNGSASTGYGPSAKENTTVAANPSDSPLAKENTTVTANPSEGTGKPKSDDDASETSISVSSSPSTGPERSSGNPIHKYLSGATTVKAKHPHVSEEPTGNGDSPSESTAATAEPTGSSNGPQGNNSTVMEPSDHSTEKPRNNGSSPTEKIEPGNEPTGSSGGAGSTTSRTPGSNKHTYSSKVPSEGSTRMHTSDAPESGGGPEQPGDRTHPPKNHLNGTTEATGGSRRPISSEPSLTSDAGDAVPSSRPFGNGLTTKKITITGKHGSSEGPNSGEATGSPTANEGKRKNAFKWPAGGDDPATKNSKESDKSTFGAAADDVTTEESSTSKKHDQGYPGSGAKGDVEGSDNSHPREDGSGVRRTTPGGSAVDAETSNGDLSLNGSTQKRSSRTIKTTGEATDRSSSITSTAKNYSTYEGITPLLVNEGSTGGHHSEIHFLRPTKVTGPGSEDASEGPTKSTSTTLLSTHRPKDDDGSYRADNRDYSSSKHATNATIGTNGSHGSDNDGLGPNKTSAPTRRLRSSTRSSSNGSTNYSRVHNQSSSQTWRSTRGASLEDVTSTLDISTPTIARHGERIRGAPAAIPEATSGRNSSFTKSSTPIVRAQEATTEKQDGIANKTVTYLSNGSAVISHHLLYSGGSADRRNHTDNGTNKLETQVKSATEESSNAKGKIGAEKQTPAPSGCPQIEVDLSNSLSPLRNSPELSGRQPVGTMVIHMCAVSYVFPTLQQPLKIYECLEGGKWTDNNDGEKCEYVAPRKKNSADL